MSAFGDELRRLRKRAGLSQELLAARAGLSSEAVSLLERGRRSPRMMTMRLLADALELDDTSRQAFFDAQVADDPVPVAEAEGRSLPMVSTPRFIDAFVGRGEQVHRLTALVAGGSRLITVTGPGGVGKTRLAAEVVGPQESAFPDGVRWLTLTALQEGQLLPPAVAGAIGLRLEADEPVEALLGQLAEARMLVVLDGAEHLLEAVRDLAFHLLTGTAYVSVLITSSHRLLLAGETTVEVPPLTTPPKDADAETVLASPAVQLFRAKAGLTAPPTPTEVLALARITRRLDGLPLALELAAARRQVLALPELAAALDRTLGILRTPDARGDELTERVVGWSYRLLTPDEQLILQRMTVFTSFSHASLAVVCADRWDAVTVLDLLSSLLAKSLVVRFGAEAEAARFTLFSIVRLFAAERLPVAERDVVQERHATYFTGLCTPPPESAEGDRLVWLDGLDREVSNVRLALGWRADHEPDAGLRAAADVWRWCYLRGRYTEGRRWLTTALASAPDAPAELRAAAQAALGMLAFLQCDYAEGEAAIERARAVYTELGDTRQAAWCLTRLGSIARERGAYERARALHEQSLDLARAAADHHAIGVELNYLTFACWISGDLDGAERYGPDAVRRVRRSGDDEAVVWGLVNSGVTARYRGDLRSAELLLQQALDSSERVGFREGVAWSRNQLGTVARLTGQLTRARRLQQASLEEHRQLGDRWRMSSVLDELAAIAAATGDFDAAATDLGAADRLREDIGAPVPAVEQADRAETVRRTQDALGPAYPAAVLAGSLRSVLSVEAGRPTAAPAPSVGI